MIAVQRKPLSLAGLSVDISCNSSVMDNKFPSFSYVVKRDTTVAGFATSTLATSTRTREGEFLESIKRAAPTGQTTSRKISVIVLTLLQNQQPGLEPRTH